ncbi:putative Cuticular protein [Daphnia magna]|uniref:Putative Cuticle protein n=1 Tax=Daphnia magna TaxID=35525 RepID=A0A0P5LHE8_9CRUS|nr:putative Cuticular protein [Daphnia magna]
MKFLIITFLVAVALAEKPANKRATPAYKPAPAYPAPESYPAPGYSKSYDYPAQPYNFAYDVKDDPSYNNFGHQENADGKVVSGSYRVVLPDGRTQVHTYKDEGYGLVASVKTEGAIKTYDYKPAYKASAYPAPYSPKY